MKFLWGGRAKKLEIFDAILRPCCTLGAGLQCHVRGSRSRAAEIFLALRTEVLDLLQLWWSLASAKAALLPLKCPFEVGDHTYFSAERPPKGSAIMLISWLRERPFILRGKYLTYLLCFRAPPTLARPSKPYRYKFK